MALEQSTKILGIPCCKMEGAALLPTIAVHSSAQQVPLLARLTSSTRHRGPPAYQQSRGELPTCLLSVRFQTKPYNYNYVHCTYWQTLTAPQYMLSIITELQQPSLALGFLIQNTQSNLDPQNNWINSAVHGKCSLSAPTEIVVLSLRVQGLSWFNTDLTHCAAGGEFRHEHAGFLAYSVALPGAPTFSLSGDLVQVRECWIYSRSFKNMRLHFCLCLVL